MLNCSFILNIWTSFLNPLNIHKRLNLLTFRSAVVKLQKQAPREPGLQQNLTKAETLWPQTFGVSCPFLAKMARTAKTAGALTMKSRSHEWTLRNDLRTSVHYRRCLIYLRRPCRNLRLQVRLTHLCLLQLLKWVSLHENYVWFTWKISKARWLSVVIRINNNVYLNFFF